MIASKHYRYIYKNEIPPNVLFKKMIISNIEEIYTFDELSQMIDYNFERKKIYFDRRKELYNLIKSINNYISNSSQSFVLALYFMDTIFTNDNLENIFFSHFEYLNYLNPLNDISMNSYVMLSLACLIISIKYYENDPKMPTASSFIKLVEHFSENVYSFTISDLAMAEVVAIKLLKYKLNFYTIYHFLEFFFTHGIIFKTTIQHSQLYGKLTETKILEKIYAEVKEILDWINESDEYYNYYYGKDNHIIVVGSLIWSIEHILGIKLSDNENIFKLIYDININYDKHIKMNEIIEKLYIDKKGSLVKNNNLFDITKKQLKKYISFNNPTSFNTITENSNINYNNDLIQSIKKDIFSLYNANINNTLSTYDESFSFNNNNLIHNELDNYNSIYPYQFSYQQTESIIPKTTSFIQNSFYNSNNNATFNYDINSIKTIHVNPIDNFSAICKIKKNKSKIEKTPTDNKKKPKNSERNTKIISKIDNKNLRDKKNYRNNGRSIKKKLLSCSNINGNNNCNYQINQNFIDNNIIDNNNNIIMSEDELKFKEKINKPKIINNKFKNNIHYNSFNISPKNNLEKKPKNSIKYNNDTLFQKYQHATKSDNYSNILNRINNIPESKIITMDELLKQTKNLYTVTKINQRIENEPRDNNKKNINRLKKKNLTCNINSSNNNRKKIHKINCDKQNFMSINNDEHNHEFNNIQNHNIKENNPTKKIWEKNKSNYLVIKNYNENNINDYFTLQNFDNNYLIHGKKNIIIYERNNENNIINKSATVENGFNNNNEFIFTNHF